MLANSFDFIIPSYWVVNIKFVFQVLENPKTQNYVFDNEKIWSQILFFTVFTGNWKLRSISTSFIISLRGFYNTQFLGCEHQINSYFMLNFGDQYFVRLYIYIGIRLGRHEMKKT